MEIYINPWSYIDVYAHSGCGVNFDFAITLDRFAMDYASWGDLDGLPGGNTSIAANNGNVWMEDSTLDGYVGMNNFVMGSHDEPAITIDGGISIDVVTTNSGVYSYIYSLLTALSAGSPHLDITDRAQMYNLFAMLETAGIDLNDGGDVVSFLNGYFFGMSGGTINLGLTYTDLPLTIVHISFPQDFSLKVAQMTGDVVLGNTDNFAAGTYKELGDFYIGGLDLTINNGSWIDIWAH